MSECKYQLLEDLVSYDDGGLWESQNPPVYLKGNLIEPDSPDCDGYDGYLKRWIPIDGGYICEGNNKYIKEILQYSTDGGVTWYPSNPITVRPGEFVKVDEEFCSYLYEGHYVYVPPSTPGPTPTCRKRWHKYIPGVGCVYFDPLKIIKCTGKTNITDYDTPYYNPTNWNLISAKIGGCAASIDYAAFSGWDSTRTVTSVTFTDATNLITIGDSAFSGCSSLTNIELPDSVTTISSNAFSHCSSLTDITIPDSVTTIGGNAFGYCTNLSRVTIGSGVTSIGGNAFQGCTSLTSIEIPDSVTSIGGGAFWGCSSLSSCTIGNGVTEISDGTFNHCGGLISCTIGSGVTSIRYMAFNNCSGLTGITINATTPPSLAYDAFDNTNDCLLYVPCESVTDYASAENWSAFEQRIVGIPPCAQQYRLQATYNGGGTYNLKCSTATTLTQSDVRGGSYSYSAMTGAVVGDCTTAISSYTFENCTSLSNVTIGSGVTSIGANAFSGCTSLSSITLGNSVVSIDYQTFKNCSSLTGITIPDSVATIGGIAFSGCTSLSSVTIGSGVTSISYSSFSGCRNLTSIDIPSGVTSIGGAAFDNCSGLTGVTINATTPPSLGNNAFANTNDCLLYVPCEATMTYRTTSGWTSYKDRIVGMPPCVEPTKFQATYTSGRTYTAYCDDNTTLDYATTSSGYGLNSLVSIDIGSCITSIGGAAFENAGNLSSVTIPDSVTSIGIIAFINCSGLTSITINATTPPSLGSDVFYNTSSNLVIYVPASSVDSYKSTENWSNYASRIQAIP